MAQVCGPGPPHIGDFPQSTPACNNLSNPCTEPDPPSEFDLPLAGTAVWAGPEGIGGQLLRPRPRAGRRGDAGAAGRRPADRPAADARHVRDRRDRDHDARARPGDGMTANAFTSVSLEPPLVLISVMAHQERGSCTRAGPTASASWARRRAISRPLRRAAPNPRAPDPRSNHHDTPLVDGALADFVADVTRSTGAATTAVPRPRRERRDREGTPLLFHGGRYERLGTPS